MANITAHGKYNRIVYVLHGSKQWGLPFRIFDVGLDWLYGPSSDGCRSAHVVVYATFKPSPFEWNAQGVSKIDYRSRPISQWVDPRETVVERRPRHRVQLVRLDLR